MSTRVRATIITAGFLILLSLILIGIWLVLQGRYLRAEQQSKVHIATDLIAEVSVISLTEGNILRLAVNADRAATSADISRVLITDRTGVVIVDSEHSAYNTRPSIVRRALASESTVIETGPEYWTGASAVRNEFGQELGCAMVEFPADTLIAAQRSAWVVGVIIALIGVAAGSLLAFFAARIITEPLDRLLAGIRRVQAGESATSVATTGTPELVEIGNAFNEMADTVHERVRKLELLNQMAASLPLAVTLEEIATTIGQYADSILEGESYLWIADQFSRMLIPIPAFGKAVIGEAVPASCPCAVGRAFAERRTIVAGEDTRDLPPDSELVQGLVVRSGMVLPLITPDGVAGVLVVANPGRRREITPEAEALARAIGYVAGSSVMARLRAESQARTAAAMQSLLVPAGAPDIGIDVFAAYAPAEEIAGLGGDYYDIFQLSVSRWVIVVGDASGKGLTAARYAATAKYVIRSYVLEYDEPAEALHWSNRALVAQEQTGTFLTAFCGILDISDGMLMYTNAGHTPPWVYHRATGQISNLPLLGTALGIASDVLFEESEIKLESGDILCICTDGITEARRNGEWFGDHRLPDIIKDNADLSSNEIGERIMQEVRTFTEGALKDDIVLIVLKMP